VLRGYGDDEAAVHRMLAPDVPVVVSADRLAGAAEAARRGCDVVVLDDAFQHRRARRAADFVLVSADRWRTRARVLPAGPFREPPSGLRRATLVIITRKSASDEDAERTRAWVQGIAPAAETSVVHLAPDELREWGSDRHRAAASVDGLRVLAIAAVGDTRAFARQLEALGARVELRAFGDHHLWDDAEVRRLADEARRADLVACTLKDAVKLGPAWPRTGPPLWYVSQRVSLERGGGAVDRVLDEMAARARSARTPLTIPTAGPAPAQ